MCILQKTLYSPFCLKYLLYCNYPHVILLIKCFIYKYHFKSKYIVILSFYRTIYNKKQIFIMKRKNRIRLNESQLHNIIRESVKQVIGKAKLNEIGDTPKGAKALDALSLRNFYIAVR